MITVFYKEVNSQMIEMKPGDITTLDVDYLKKSWIHLDNPNIEEINVLLNIMKLDYSNFQNALDKDESAHIDIDEDLTHIVLDASLVNTKKEELNEYTTMPFSILYNKDFFVTVSFETCAVVRDFSFFKNKEFNTIERSLVASALVFKVTSDFVANSRLIVRDVNSIESKLNLNPKNEELLVMLELAKSLVFLLTAINSNKSLIYKLKKTKEFTKNNECLDLITDAEIELNQAKEVVLIYREILNNRINSYSIIINNNVNRVMRVLTLITISLSIPTIVSSFYGMNNMVLPFTSEKNIFWYLFIVSIVFIVIANILMSKLYNNKRK